MRVPDFLGMLSALLWSEGICPSQTHTLRSQPTELCYWEASLWRCDYVMRTEHSEWNKYAYQREHRGTLAPFTR